MFTFPLLITIYAGFIHAFEADHLLAVSNIVSQRNNIWSSMKDGTFWGLGHASTICFIGLLMILFKVGIPDQYFHYFEATVGLMLIVLAVYRLIIFFRSNKIVVHAHGHHHSEEGHHHKHLHVHLGSAHAHTHSHKLAYGVGLVHGLAGSGVLILIAMTQMKTVTDGLIYLVIFSGGCVVGMLVAAGLFSIPFSKKIINSYTLQGVLIIITSLLCLGYGARSIYVNLFA